MSDYSKWPAFVSRSVVQAAPIVEIREECGAVVSVLVKPFGSDRLERFVPTEEDSLLLAEIGGYAVIYDGVYRSFYPKGFEKSYVAA
jgi:hypothetical protein